MPTDEVQTEHKKVLGMFYRTVLKLILVKIEGEGTAEEKIEHISDLLDAINLGDNNANR